MLGQVVKLDRGFPLALTEGGNRYRCKHATALIKEKKMRAVIGDWVELSLPKGHDNAIIENICPRKTSLIRKDPTEQALPQVLAANFDRILIAQAFPRINRRRLERELVLAHETGAKVIVLLTKADLVKNELEQETQLAAVKNLVGQDIILAVSIENKQSIEALRDLVPPGETAVLVGKSGVGKSSLVNLLVGSELRETASVRKTDGKGRHTTVSREIIEVPRGGQIIDMPGVRGLGLWDAEIGIETAFSDIEELSLQCRFRDCKHKDEPGCAVIEAVDQGDLALSRLASYRALRLETEEIQERREEAKRLRIRTGHPRKRKG